MSCRRSVSRVVHAPSGTRRHDDSVCATTTVAMTTTSKTPASGAIAKVNIQRRLTAGTLLGMYCACMYSLW